MAYRKSNVERSGERSLVWSRLMRRPGYPDLGGHSVTGDALRSCDFDPVPICNKCKLPFMLVEETRNLNRVGHFTYTKSIAKKLEVPAFVVVSKNEGAKFEIMALATGQKFTASADKVVEWIERKYEEHYAICKDQQ